MLRKEAHMITVTNAGLATTALVANQVSLNVAIREKVCRYAYASKCAKCNISTNVTYTTGTPVLDNTTVFVPVTAVVNVVKGSCSVPVVFSETFIVAFQGQTALPASVAVTRLGSCKNPDRCGIINVNDSITVALTPAA